MNGAVELHWQGKFRGPDFAPLTFSLRTVTHEQLKDSKGRLMPTVVASHLSAAAQQEIEKVARSREDQLLALLAKPESRNASQRDLANQLGWFTRDGSPYQMLVSRTISALKKEKLVTIVRGSIELTPAGRKCVEGSKSLGQETYRSKETPSLTCQQIGFRHGNASSTGTRSQGSNSKSCCFNFRQPAK